MMAFKKAIMTGTTLSPHHTLASRSECDCDSASHGLELPHSRNARFEEFESLVRRWEPIVFRVCRQLFPDVRTAETCCEDAFVALYRSDADLAESPVLLSVLLGYVISASLVDPSDRPQGTGVNAKVHESLGRLLPGDRELIVLRFLNQSSVEEIARLQKRSPKEVRTRLWNAMAAMERSVGCSGAN